MVKSVRFTSDDQFLLTAGGLDKSIFLWNVSSIDNDPTMLTMDFAVSHLEQSKLNQSIDHGNKNKSRRNG